MQQPPLRQSQQRQLEAQRQLRRRIGLAVLVTLVLTGIGVWLSQQDFSRWLPEKTEAAAAPAAPMSATSTNAVRQQTAQAPERETPEEIDQFSFYRDLPSMTVEVDARPLPVRLEQPRRVLAGTFRRRELAEKELARLRRLGFERLQLASFKKNGVTYYQLRTPPLDNRLKVNLRRNRLQKAGARVLVVRVPRAVKGGG
ncbi:SPOR domain-containing protein [Sulfurivirga sp.]|uniref:SPOR domain-containing protein n=1 Tax=Sulfurivirga sp. TaxID=2614236 RepID=UPI0025CFDD5F|nr:SPOR domain-containing protein [Sulfurivirga sp.]